MDKDFALIKLASRVTVTNPVKMDQGTISPNYPAGKHSFGTLEQVFNPLIMYAP